MAILFYFSNVDILRVCDLKEYFIHSFFVSGLIVRDPAAKLLRSSRG